MYWGSRGFAAKDSIFVVWRWRGVNRFWGVGCTVEVDLKSCHLEFAFAFGILEPLKPKIEIPITCALQLKPKQAARILLIKTPLSRFDNSVF